MHNPNPPPTTPHTHNTHTHTPTILCRANAAELDKEKAEGQLNGLEQARARLLVKARDLQGALDNEKALRVQAESAAASFRDRTSEVEKCLTSAEDNLAAVQKSLTSVEENVKDANDGKTAVGISELLGVSPTSMDKVKRMSRGSLRTCLLDDATPPEEGERNRFLEKVTNVLSPAVEKICSMAKFKNNKTDKQGVARLILKGIARGKSRRRKLRFDDRPMGVSVELDSLLKEMATSWRSAFRDKDRHTAHSLLQITLKAIPQRTGRVSDWLGPKYFDAEVPVERDCHIRLLKNTKWAKFRNAYANTSLGE